MAACVYSDVVDVAVVFIGYDGEFRCLESVVSVTRVMLQESKV